MTLSGYEIFYHVEDLEYLHPKGSLELSHSVPFIERRTHVSDNRRNIEAIARYEAGMDLSDFVIKNSREGDKAALVRDRMDHIIETGKKDGQKYAVVDTRAIIHYFRQP
ncbi:hypothetical protein HYU11_03880 [Candidatus Woesearchaeota archaeon]|nr:hypothetical protein [Candidatus Woesearchaeota archaeon]